MYANILSAQNTKIIKGKIISEDFELLPKVIVYNIDTVALCTTNLNGCFKVEVPIKTNKLLLEFVGMEWTFVSINDDCKNIEIIMMINIIYDFISINRINKNRYKRFKNIQRKHLKAYKQGIFQNRYPCVSYIFKKYQKNASKSFNQNKVNQQGLKQFDKGLGVIGIIKEQKINK